MFRIPLNQRIRMVLTVLLSCQDRLEIHIFRCENKCCLISVNIVNLCCKENINCGGGGVFATQIG
ncbi:hypothetical protein CDQ84_08880 [Clostridium thermosuccinogenes]|uniref:Uncharacterized protein n=1 Tax=Clostridium thermosuccinogenes TaxID=84032 RepID=A0A2K2FKK3_9CLOT|nr:hypothetical protein CDO33_15185 [Pseudoclostridium thermosuccinogenes]PNT97381.1 hypothetical protein CDQ85_08730 [Pseudoclostridium thermosuccinogenes]PNT99317.1 hypothetical protein CDQ84_08880 [Pseudoclostridium thermosuccinogenes]